MKICNLLRGLVAGLAALATQSLPTTPDELAQLTGSDSVPGNQFGLAMTREEDTAVFGSFTDTCLTFDCKRAAHVLTRDVGGGQLRHEQPRRFVVESDLDSGLPGQPPG